MSVVNQKRIAKNTIFLYIRMLLIMAVSLYTTRVILQVLGVDDFGVYNLVGGFVALFSFVSNAMVGAVQRFMNVALGKNDTQQFRDVYSMSINVFIVLSIVLIIVCETVGIWFLNHYLNIPPNRMHAAFWVFQISIASFIVVLFRSTDNAAIIAHEKMHFYAIISILEAIIKLLIVYLLLIVDYDKLILYALLYLGATLLVNLMYKIYCNRKIPNCRYSIGWNKSLFKSLMSFSGWNLLMSGTHVVEQQGESFITNHYYGVSLNAARGVSAQIYNAVNLFLINFQTAFKPQLIQSHAAGEMAEHYDIIKRYSRLSFMLLVIIVIPVIFNLNKLLRLWLVDIPPYTQDFCIYILIAYLFDAISSPLGTSVMANGRIKGLMLLSSVCYILGLVSTFLIIKFINIPFASSIVCAVVHLAFFFIYLYYCNKICNLVINDYLKAVVPRVLIVAALSVAVLWRMSFVLQNVFLSTSCGLMAVLIIVMLFGLNHQERSFLIHKIRSLCHKV